MTATRSYTLHIPPAIERQISRLSQKAQRGIRAALLQAVLSAPTSPFGTAAEPLDPALRLYAIGYRVFYQVERDTHRVVVVQVLRAFA